MDLAGARVTHKTFGDGTITKHDGKSVHVLFDLDSKTRPFQYPDSLGTFLILADKRLTASILNARDEAAMKKEEENKAARLAQERLMVEKQIRDDRHSNSNKATKIPAFASVDGFCEKFSSEVSKEIYQLRSNAGNKYKAFDGKRIGYANGAYIYSFETESELYIPEGTQITIVSVSDKTTATIGNCEEFSMIIYSSHNLDNEISEIEFTVEFWQLLTALNERLSEMKDAYSPIAKALICDGQYAMSPSEDINKGSDTAIKMSSSQPITFIWGPPGTGKTHTLAQIALKHIQAGNRVLMLSYSNVSVDGAVLKIDEIQKKRRIRQIPGQVLRYGYPRQKELLDHDFLTSFNYVIRQHPELAEERKRLIEEKSHLRREDKRAYEISKRLGAIRAILADEEKAQVRRTSFVATTISKTIIDKTIYGQKFDVVIFDEASMAYIPQLIFSANLAKKHFICIGDFKQLPPIVLSGKESLLNADIFRYCGIATAVDKRWGHNWLCLLDHQYRMHPDIADFVSKRMYRNLLKSAPDMESKRNPIKESRPMSGAAMGIVDLSGMMSVCRKANDQSRVNVLSAFVSCSLAISAGKQYEVGIISPYKAQSRLIHAMMKDVAEKLPDIKPCTSATVHQFQGSEREIIIYDAVDCYRMPYPGTLLTSQQNDISNRLFNVAVTRAQGKFLAVANVDYMKVKNVSKQLLFRGLLDSMGATNTTMNGRVYIDNFHSIPNDVLAVMSGSEANDRFLFDIRSAKREIRMDIPGAIDNNEPFLTRLREAIHERKGKGVKVYIRVAEKNDIPSALRGLTIQNDYITDPVALIDEQTIWFGMPHSLANFISDDKAIKTLYRPIFRFVGKHTRRNLFGALQMSQTIEQIKKPIDEEDAITNNFASYVAAHKKCPACGKNMRLKQKGSKFFLGCFGYPTCRQTEYVAVDLVNDYLLKYRQGEIRCPKDNSSLEAKLGPYGVYLVCNGLTKHRSRLDEI